MIEIDRLVAHALGDVEDDVVDEHILACGTCAHTFEQLLELGGALRELVGTGRLPFAIGPRTLERLVQSGLVARTYVVEAGGSVACGVGPNDIYQSATLHADLSGVTRLDVIKHVGDKAVRLSDVPFDARTGTVCTVERADFLRTLPTMQVVIELVDGTTERTIARYYFNHTA